LRGYRGTPILPSKLILADEQMANKEAVEILTKDGVSAWNSFRRRTPAKQSIAGATFEREHMDSADFSSCDLSQVRFIDCSIRHADFKNAELQEATFSNCNLTGAIFDSANLTRVEFRGCSLADADFSESSNFDRSAFIDCSGLDSALLPEDEIPFAEEQEEEEEEEEEEHYVELDGHKRKIPSIPRQVPAPIETVWIKDKLTVEFHDHESLLSHSIIEANIVSFKVEIQGFLDEVRKTNIDLRVIERLDRTATEFPTSGSEFSARIFQIWHQFRPIFEYSKLVQSEQADYIRARFITLEGDLRSLLNAFPSWRSYDYAAHHLFLPEEFDFDRLSSTKDEIIAALQKFPQEIDRSVLTSLKEINVNFFGIVDRSSVYDFAAAHVNVLSRLLKKLLSEVALGGAEGIREGTKKLVAGIMVGGGATMVWLITSGLKSFPWLGEAWNFVRRLIGL
jgi:uncharacterized protein YjbI with pentapeptide repeats